MEMSSSATVRVEKATSDLLLGPDWTMNMEICDSINSDPGSAKDVVKVVKKRLQHKGPRVQFLALTLLETMIKNCGDFVHFQVVERDILQEMVRIVKKKTDMEVRDKILVLLDSWQEAFGGPGGKYPQFFWAYTDLKRSGVEFPHRSGDASLIFTPPTNHTSAPRHPQVGYGMPSNSTVRLDEAMASEMEKLSLSDLDRFRSVMDLLNDMLKAVNPHDREAVKDEVIADLVDQCRSNQKKILQLIDATGDEELLGQGLALNDSLQILLAKHNSIASGSPLPDEASISAPRPNTPPAPATSLTTNRFIEDEEEEDDEFAQLARRSSKTKPTFESASTESSALAVSSIDVNGMTAAMVNTNEVTSSSVGGNALALPDPPPPVKTTTKEQNIIDLLSITLSLNPSPPHTPITPSTTSHKKGSPEPLTTNGQGYPHSPQTYPLNQGYIPYSSYTAPWAKTLPPSSSESQHIQAQPHPNFHFRSEQQPPPQPQYLPRQHLEHEPSPPPEHQPQHQLLPSQQPQPQFPPSQNPQQHRPHPQSQVIQDASYPPPPWEDTSNTNPNPFTQPTYRFPASTLNTSSSYIPAQASMTPQQFNSFGMSAANPPVVIGQTRASTNIRPAGSAAAKPFVPSYRLFEDLVDMRNPNGVVKASNASGQDCKGRPTRKGSQLRRYLNTITSSKCTKRMICYAATTVRTL